MQKSVSRAGLPLSSNMIEAAIQHRRLMGFWSYKIRVHGDIWRVCRPQPIFFSVLKYIEKTLLDTKRGKKGLEAEVAR